MRVLGTIGRRTVLLGAVGALAMAGVIVTAAPAFAAATLTLNTIGGPSEGGNVITATVGSALFTAGDPTKSRVQFQARGTVATCSASFGTATPITYAAAALTVGIIDATSVTVPDAQTLIITVPSSLLLGGTPLQTTAVYNVCVYPAAGVNSNLLLADTETAVGYGLSPNKVALSGYQGPALGANMIIATMIGTTFPAGAFGAQLQNALGGYCRAAYGAQVTIGPAAGVLPIPADAMTVLVPNKVAITIPTGLVLSGVTTANYNLCIYSTDQSAGVLVAGTALPYVIAAASTITGVSPVSGPAQGGTLITVTGTNFAAGMTVMLAGQPLTGYTVSGGFNSFTVRTPPHAAGGPFTLLVTTAAGPAALNLTGGKTANFVYTNGITVVPTTATNTSFARTWLDVQGVGFADLQFGTTTGVNSNDAKAHVYLSRGAYDPKTLTAGVKTNPQTLECVDVYLISDTELICGLYLAGNQASTTTTRTVTGCTATSGSAALTGSTCLFTAADIGMAVTGTGIAPNTGSGTPAPNASTTILSVSTAGAATLSKNATAAVSGNLTLTSSRTISDAVFAATLTSALVPFTTADIGKAVSGTGVPNGEVITAVDGSNVATLLIPLTGSAPAVTIFTPYPVSNATYTITVVNSGLVNAQATPGYSQSIISSGSTFTVADYFR